MGPKLMNRKQAVGISITIDVFPSDRITGAENRELSRKSLNSITWSYDTPVIKQYTVIDHPSMKGYRIVTLIGSSFGSITDGPNSNDIYRMKINVYSARGQAYNPPQEASMKFINQNISDSTGNFVHLWKEGYQNRFDKVVLVWDGPSGNITIARGGDESNLISFSQ